MQAGYNEIKQLKSKWDQVLAFQEQVQVLEIQDKLLKK